MANDKVAVTSEDTPKSNNRWIINQEDESQGYVCANCGMVVVAYNGKKPAHRCGAEME